MRCSAGSGPGPGSRWTDRSSPYRGCARGDRAARPAGCARGRSWGSASPRSCTPPAASSPGATPKPWGLRDHENGIPPGFRPLAYSPGGTREVAERGITVNTIQPGPIDEAGVFIDSVPADSPFRGSRAAGRIGNRIGTTKDVADAAEYLAGDLAAWTSGTTLAVTGGLPQ